MSTPISFPRDAVTVLPDGAVAGTRKRKPVNDPDNIEVARLATLAARKKARLSKSNRTSKKKATNQKSGSKSNCQPSIEGVKDIDNTQHRIFSKNPKNILKSSDDDEEEATTKTTNLSIPTPSQKNKTSKPTQNPKNILELSDDDEEEATTRMTNFSKPTPSQKKKTNNKLVSEPNRQPSVEDVDDPADNLLRVFPRNPRSVLESNDDSDDETSNAPATS
jgi:hypothetical protein